VIAVIQCAARKRPEAGHLETPSGQPVTFVANPRAIEPDDDMLYEHPDDTSGYGGTWRDTLLKYNQDLSKNPLRLLPAWQLYDEPTYGRLAKHVGVENLFILSAGWGLIRADFLTPVYDITFSGQAEAYKHREQTAEYRDLNMLGAVTDDIVFFGGKDYLRQFCKLTAAAKGRRIVFYKAKNARAAGCELRYFESSNPRKWHYECANAFVNGELANL
jgi:hypothetical protein